MRYICLLILIFSTKLFAEERESRALGVASQQAVLSSELAAKIDNIPVKEMQRFKKGDLLIQLSLEGFRQETMQKKLNLFFQNHFYI